MLWRALIMARIATGEVQVEVEDERDALSSATAELGRTGGKAHAKP